jgi:hypothetical protein
VAFVVNYIGPIIWHAQLANSTVLVGQLATSSPDEGPMRIFKVEFFRCCGVYMVQ